MEKEKRADFPFNFYIVTFGEKNAHLAREFSSLAAFSKIQTYVCLDYEKGAKELNSCTPRGFFSPKVMI